MSTAEDRIAALGAKLDDVALSAMSATLATGQPSDRVAEGTSVLDATRRFFARFCAFPGAAELDAVTLWAAHAHMVEHFHSTPRLALLSPEPASGKTRVLEILHLLVPEPMFSLSASAAAVFRTLADRQITLLFDEVDTIWRNRGKDDTNEDLRALINAGYRKGATIPRCVGPSHDVRQFDVHCATALAGLGDLPDTVMSRAVIIRMRRRAPNEQVEPFRLRQHEGEGHLLRDRLTVWAESVGASAGSAWPEMPPGITDRPAEIWEPLLAVADAAGNHWPETARAACVALCRTASDRRASLGIRLLADLRMIFGDADALHTEVIVQRLCGGDVYGLEADAPWSELHGKPLTGRVLASMLNKYAVKPQKVTVGGRSLQGYRRSTLWECWQRYLPASSPAQPEHPELPVMARPGEPIAVPGIPDRTGNGELSGIGETRATSEGVPAIPDIPDFRGRSADDIYEEAAQAAGIPADRLRNVITPADLAADPDIDLLTWARGLAREVRP